MQRITKSINLHEGDPEKKRVEILKYFHDSFDLEEKLFETLSRNETYFLRADPLRHPLIFYLDTPQHFISTNLFWLRFWMIGSTQNWSQCSQLEWMK